MLLFLTYITWNPISLSYLKQQSLFQLPELYSFKQPPCLEEALRQGSFLWRTVFMVRVWIESILVCFYKATFHFGYVPSLYGVARPPRRGLAGQGCFFKNHAHKTALKSPRGRPFGSGDVHRIRGEGCISPQVCNALNISITPKKQR